MFQYDIPPIAHKGLRKTLDLVVRDAKAVYESYLEDPSNECAVTLRMTNSKLMSGGDGFALELPFGRGYDYRCRVERNGDALAVRMLYRMVGVAVHFKG